MRTVNSEELKVQLEAFRGPQGPAGEDYILTEADKKEIAGMIGGTGGGGSSVELDTTLSVFGKAADAGAVGKAIDALSEDKLDKQFGKLNAGKLLYINADGFVHPLALGDGLEIVDGVLTIANTQVAKAICGTALVGQVTCGEV